MLLMHLSFLSKNHRQTLPQLHFLGLSGIVLLFWHDLINSQFNAQLLMGIGLCAVGTYGFFFREHD